MTGNTQSGAFSSTSASSSQQVHYDTPAIQVGNQVRDGDEFILLVRDKQSNGFQAWSSSDKSTTAQLMQQATRQLQNEPVTT
jgi:hypothetical protein